VKYMILIYQNPVAWEALGDDERRRVMDDAGAIVNELVASGELVGGEGLAHPTTARTVRVRDGVPAITDGPFLEAKEHLGGFYLIDCEDKERAIELAARIPDAAIEGLGVEVRQVMFADGVLEA